MSEQGSAVPTPGVARSRWQTWGKPALLASLALNLLLVGGMVGGMMARHRHGGPGGAQAPIERGIIAFVRTNLPRDRAQALLQSVEGQRPAFRAARKDLRQARDAAFEAFTAGTLDQVALRAALTKAGEADDKFQALGTNVFVDLAGRMTPAERQAYRAWREAQDRHHHGPGESGRDGKSGGMMGRGDPAK